jgi:WD40-like Beta Propeller Repeat
MRRVSIHGFVSALLAGGVVLVGACVSYSPIPVAIKTTDAAGGDGAGALESGAPDAGASRCNVQKDFAAPLPLLLMPPWQPGDFQGSASLTADEKTLYFTSGSANTDIFVATRSDAAGAFGQPKRVSELSGPSPEAHVSVTEDGKTIFFSRRLAQGVRLHFATSVTAGVFGNIGVIEFPDASAISPRTQIDDFAPSIQGGLLYFASSGRGSGSSDMFKVSVPYANVKPSAVSELNTDTSREEQAILSADGLQVYFASDRSPSQSVDIWRARRNAAGDNFLPPEIVSALASGEQDFPNWLSPDGCTIYLTRQITTDAGTGFRIYVAQRPL